MYDLIIVGGGPAGLTAAIYAVHRRLDVLLFSENLGGKTDLKMSFPGVEMHRVIRGVEVVDRFRRELEYLDFANRLETVVAIDKQDGQFIISTRDGGEYTAKSVILATGTRMKYLNVPGEQEYFGRAVSYSAVSYASVFAGKHATVIGDGNLALRAVAELSKVAAAIHLVAPTQGALKSAMAQKLLSHKMDTVVLVGYKVKEIQGVGFADRVIVESPEGEESEIRTDGIFVELGLIPNSELVKGLADLDEQRRVIIDVRNRTNCLGLFAAGDVTTAYAEQVLIAVGEGAKAALSAHEYVLSY